MRNRSLAFILIVGLAVFSAGPAFGASSDIEDATPEPTPAFNETASSDETSGPGDGESANTPPTVEPIQESVDQGKTAAIKLKGSGDEEDDLTYEISGLNPSDLGTIELNGDTVTFTASASKTGTATFTYTASNANGTSGPATVSLTVKKGPAQNKAPTAEPVSAGTVKQGESTTFSLFGEDPDKDPLTYRIVKGPPKSQGKAEVSKDGKVTFTAAATYAGSVSFTYLVSDGKADSSAATVSLIVVAPSPEPEPSPSGTSSPSSSASPSDLPGTTDPEPTSEDPSGEAASEPEPSSSDSDTPTQITTDAPSSSPDPTATAISVPTHTSAGGNGLEGNGMDGRDLGMGAVVVGASGLLFLGIRKLTLPEK
ncbi:Ig-like domain-containing protein [Ancrocorticia populi]|uniref:Ig-like domain-containing protein n=1 Tax=Ancrocorticia populi TaxID=2175228 RepID=UPI003F8E2FA7